MMREIILSPRVEQDLVEHYAFIAQDKIQPAERLLIAAEDAFHRLAQTPFIGLLWKSKRRETRELRFYPLPSPYRGYLIFYRATDTRVEIVAVLHGTRDLHNALDDILD